MKFLDARPAQMLKDARKSMEDAVRHSPIGTRVGEMQNGYVQKAEDH